MDNCGDTFLINLYKFQNGTNPCKNHYVISGLEHQLMSISETFKCISEILPGDPLTWESKLFITFDIDWAHDEVLSDTIDLIEQADVAATWFVTHDTTLLERLRNNPKIRIGHSP